VVRSVWPAQPEQVVRSAALPEHLALPERLAQPVLTALQPEVRSTPRLEWRSLEPELAAARPAEASWAVQWRLQPAVVVVEPQLAAPACRTRRAR
jgi:hypothetical protein